MTVYLNGTCQLSNMIKDRWDGEPVKRPGMLCYVEFLEVARGVG